MADMNDDDDRVDDPKFTAQNRKRMGVKGSVVKGGTKSGKWMESPMFGKRRPILFYFSLAMAW